MKRERARESRLGLDARMRRGCLHVRGARPCVSSACRITANERARTRGHASSQLHAGSRTLQVADESAASVAFRGEKAGGRRLLRRRRWLLAQRWRCEAAQVAEAAAGAGGGRGGGSPNREASPGPVCSPEASLNLKGHPYGWPWVNMAHRHDKLNLAMQV